MDKNTISHINANKLSSVMNNSKWRALIKLLNSKPNYSPEVIIKYIYSDDVSLSYSQVWWDLVERDGFEQIEWMKINPCTEQKEGSLTETKSTDYSEFIQNALDSCNISYDVTEGIFTVYGYKRLRT